MCQILITVGLKSRQKLLNQWMEKQANKEKHFFGANQWPTERKRENLVWFSWKIPLPHFSLVFALLICVKRKDFYQKQIPTFLSLGLFWHSKIMVLMETDSIECLIDNDEIHHIHQFSSTKSQAGATVVISPATSVYELLECPVCTNSMYPPIHQVRISSSSRNIGEKDLIELCCFLLI